MLAFSFCILLEIMERGKLFRCSQPWLFGIFESQKHCLFTVRVRSKFSRFEYSRIIAEDAHKLVIAFLFVSNHSA